MDKHFCVTVYIFNPISKKFLFIKHKKLLKWLLPGGHIDPNENPEDAAIREVKEETGLDVKLVGERFPTEKDLIKPYALQKNTIKENEHEHYDLIYLAYSNNEDVILNDVETDGIGWFSIEEIRSEDFDTFEDKKILCEYFYKISINN